MRLNLCCWIPQGPVPLQEVLSGLAGSSAAAVAVAPGAIASSSCRASMGQSWTLPGLGPHRTEGSHRRVKTAQMPYLLPTFAYDYIYFMSIL